MPLSKGVRFRVKTSKKGKRVRLAFKGDKVVEATKINDSPKAVKKRQRELDRHGDLPI